MVVFIRSFRSALWLTGVALLSAFFTFVLFTRSPAPWVQNPTLTFVTDDPHIGSSVNKSGSPMTKTVAQDPYIRIGSQIVTTKPSKKDELFLQSIRDGSIKVAQNDPRLIQVIEKYFLFGPSNEEYNMKVTEDEEDTSMGQANAVNNILAAKMGGFFVECGALDGETRSNTYFFERYLQWKGILIEADPSNFELLLKKHRKSYSLNACLSTSPHPEEVVFKQQFNIGQIIKEKTIDPKQKGLVRVLCFPLYSVMLAMKITTVDYFSLDVEGAELEVLKTIPLNELNVRTLSVEYSHVKGGEKVVQKYMETNGFKVHSKVNNKLGLANDFIFMKADF